MLASDEEPTLDDNDDDNSERVPILRCSETVDMGQVEFRGRLHRTTTRVDWGEGLGHHDVMGALGKLPPFARQMRGQLRYSCLYPPSVTPFHVAP